MQAALIERLQYWADDAFELQPGEIARMRTDIRQAAAEIERLRACLQKANDQAEHFEREWYLRGNEIERLDRQSIPQPASDGNT